MKLPSKTIIKLVPNQHKSNKIIDIILPQMQIFLDHRKKPTHIFYVHILATTFWSFLVETPNTLKYANINTGEGEGLSTR